MSTHKRAPFATTAPDPLEILESGEEHDAGYCHYCGSRIEVTEENPQQLSLLPLPAFLRRQAE